MPMRAMPRPRKDRIRQIPSSSLGVEDEHLHDRRGEQDQAGEAQCLSVRRMPATSIPIATAARPANSRRTRRSAFRAGRDRAVVTLADEQHRAGDQGGEEGGEPEACGAGRLARPPPRPIEPEGAEQIYRGRIVVEHRQRPDELVGPGWVVEERLSNQIQPRGGDDGQHGAGELRQIVVELLPRDAGPNLVRRQAASRGRTVVLGENGPLD